MSHFASSVAVCFFIGYLFISLIVYSAEYFDTDSWLPFIYTYLILSIPWFPVIWISRRLGFLKSDLQWAEKTGLPLFIFCTPVLMYLYGVLIHWIVAISPAGKYIS